MRDQSRRRKMSLPVALTISLVASAFPAVGAVITVNYMRANTNRDTNACIRQTAGLDATTNSFIVSTDIASTQTLANGISVLSGTMQVQSFAGNRVVSTDAVRLQNTCVVPMTVHLVAEPGVSVSTLTGDWDKLAETIYLGKLVQPVHDPMTVALGGMDFTNAEDWDQSPIVVQPTPTSNGVGVLGNDTTGEVTIAPQSEVQLGVRLDSGADYTGNAVAGINFSILSHQAT